MMKGNEDIPDDWCICESGLPEDKNMTYEEFQKLGFGYLTAMEENNTDAKFCLLCFLKWKKYKPQPNKNYAKHLVKVMNQKKNMYYKEIIIDLKSKLPREKGEVIFENLQKEYLKNNIL